MIRCYCIGFLIVGASFRSADLYSVGQPYPSTRSEMAVRYRYSWVTAA
jgi:hypothetical protein